MIDKKERQEQVDFVDYLSSGVAFMRWPRATPRA